MPAGHAGRGSGCQSSLHVAVAAGELVPLGTASILKVLSLKTRGGRAGELDETAPCAYLPPSSA